MARAGPHRVERLVEEICPPALPGIAPGVVPDLRRALSAAGAAQRLALNGALAGMADIAAQVREAGITTAAVIFVGRVLEAHGFPDSHLYSSARHR